MASEVVIQIGCSVIEFFCIGRIYSRKKNSTKKNNINYIHYLQYTEVILLDKQINSSTIAYLLIYSTSNITSSNLGKMQSIM